MSCSPDACELTLDPNTAHRELSLSEDNRKVTRVREQQSYPDHPERFDYWDQVLSRESLTGRCYWEVEWEGRVEIGVAYRGITRRGGGDDSRLGGNKMSWSLYCYVGLYIARYNGSETYMRVCVVCVCVCVTTHYVCNVCACRVAIKRVCLPDVIFFFFLCVSSPPAPPE